MSNPDDYGFHPAVTNKPYYYVVFRSWTGMCHTALVLGAIKRGKDCYIAKFSKGKIYYMYIAIFRRKELLYSHFSRGGMARGKDYYITPKTICWHPTNMSRGLLTRGPKGHISCTRVLCAAFVDGLDRTAFFVFWSARKTRTGWRKFRSCFLSSFVEFCSTISEEKSKMYQPIRGFFIRSAWKTQTW